MKDITGLNEIVAFNYDYNERNVTNLIGVIRGLWGILGIVRRCVHLKETNTMRIFTLMIILILYPLIIFSQIDSVNVIVHGQDKIDTVSRFKVSDPGLQFSSIDLTPWQTFKDSGFIDNNGLKEGFWIEYPIDTSKLAMDNSFPTGAIKEGVYEPQLLKLTGIYVSGKKEGVWVLSWASLRNPPYFWGKFRSTEYRSDVKNGIETYYVPFSNEISMQITYRDGVPIKIEKQYTSPDK